MITECLSRRRAPITKWITHRNLWVSSSETQESASPSPPPPNSGGARRGFLRMEDHNLDIDDVLKVLDEGYDCERSKRRAGKLERCLIQDGKVLRTVVAEGAFQYPDGFSEEVYWIIHVSIETYKKKRWKK